MVWSPDLAWAYVVCEIISAVAVFPYDAARSEFASTTPAQVISTLAPTHNASEFTKAAEVAVSADGTLLFASNRGNQSIAVFDVDSATGLLALRSLALGVAWPRDISVLGASLLAIERDGGAAGRGAVGVFDIAPGPTGGGLVLPPRESHDVASPASYAYVAL
jgi:6-phosphogluconolactonase